MSKRWVIVKSSTYYKNGPGYDGISCDAANVPPGKIYDTIEEASQDAAKLTLANPIGFMIEEFIPEQGALESKGTSTPQAGKFTL